MRSVNFCRKFSEATCIALQCNGCTNFVTEKRERESEGKQVNVALINFQMKYTFLSASGEDIEAPLRKSRKTMSEVTNTPLLNHD